MGVAHAGGGRTAANLGIGTLGLRRRLAAHLGFRSPQEPQFACSAGSADPVDQIEFMADLGFAGVTDNYLLQRPPQQQARIGRALARRGLAMGSFVLAAPDGPPPWGVADTPLAAAAEAALAAADRAGGGQMNVVMVEAGGDPAAQLAAARDNLARMAELVGSRGGVLVLEAASPQRLPGALLQRAADAAAMVAAIAHPALGLLLDTCHMALAGEDAAALARRHAATLACVQIADMPGRVEPGAGELDFRPLLQALDDVGYAGLLEAEFFASRPGREGEQAVIEALRAFG